MRKENLHKFKDHPGNHTAVYSITNVTQLKKLEKTK